MLTTIAQSLFSHTLVTPLTACWFGRAFFVIRGWPIRAIATAVPSVVTPFSLTINIRHITPPYNSRDNDYSTTQVNVNTLLSKLRGWGRIGACQCYGALSVGCWLAYSSQEGGVCWLP